MLLSTTAAARSARLHANVGLGTRIDKPIFFDLLGTAKWRLHDGRVGKLSAKDAALVATLAIDGPQARDAVTSRLWPDADRTQAGDSLRQRCMRLRQKTGATIFCTGSTISLCADVVVDVLSIATREVGALLEAGELLAGLEFAESDELDAWVREQRVRVRDQRAEALAAVAEHRMSSGQIAAALPLAQAVVALTSHSEHAWRRLMRLHYLRGDRLAAIDTFDRLAVVLEDETGASPTADTIALLQLIQSGGSLGPQVGRPLPVGLVLPPKLIGRERELQTMTRTWEVGRPFLLLGDAGLGKSRLLTDFLREGQGHVVVVHGLPGDTRTRYAVVGRLLWSVASTFRLKPDEATRQELARMTPEFGAASPTPTQEADLRRAAEALLADAIDLGLSAVVVDDLHYADIASANLLRWLCGNDRLTRLHLGLAARANDDASISGMLGDWLNDSHRPVAIELQPWSTAELSALLSSLNLPEPMSGDAAARVHRRAGGHPLFTLETLRQTFLGDHAPGDGDGGTTEVRLLLERRLRQLPTDALDVLRVAAVAGSDLTAERVAQLLGRSVLSQADAWLALERAQVMQGLGFTHDLMQEAALRLVPSAVRMSLHAGWATLLAGEPQVSPDRLAEHWQAAERWREAAACWHAAGSAARKAGRLIQQCDLLERAGICHRAAANTAGEFDALHARLDSVLLREGAAKVLDALRPLRILAPDGLRKLRCDLSEVEALIDLERSAKAVAAAEAAAKAAADHPALLADAFSLQGMALVQCRRIDEAVLAQRQAAAAARAAGDPAQLLRATSSLAYVLYIADRIAEALQAQHETLRLAQTLDDSAETAAAQGSLAALLIVVGDMPAAYEHAVETHRRFREMGLSNNSSHACINLISLGHSAAYCGGRFNESLEAFHEAVHMAGDATVVSVQAKARIYLANVWLTLGQSESARVLMRELPADMPPGMRMLSCLILARAEAMDGRSGSAWLAQLDQLMTAHAHLPFVQNAFFEWSYCQVDALVLSEKLREVRLRCESQRMYGTARTLQLRELCAWGEIEARTEDAARLAAELAPYAATGMGGKTYPPEAWLVLAQAFERAGQNLRARDCRSKAVAWILETALPNVPDEFHQSFLSRNPVNLALLEWTNSSSEEASSTQAGRKCGSGTPQSMHQRTTSTGARAWGSFFEHAPHGFSTHAAMPGASGAFPSGACATPPASIGDDECVVPLLRRLLTTSSRPPAPASPRPFPPAHRPAPGSASARFPSRG